MARILPCDLRMASNRLETLKSMVAQDPASAFARYGLAMEYVNLGRLDEAMEEFHSLLGSNPDYAAGVLPCEVGRWSAIGKIDEARAMYRKGHRGYRADRRCPYAKRVAGGAGHARVTRDRLPLDAARSQFRFDLRLTFELHRIDTRQSGSFDIRRDIIGEETLGRLALRVIDGFVVDHRRWLQRAYR